MRRKLRKYLLRCLKRSLVVVFKRWTPFSSTAHLVRAKRGKLLMLSTYRQKSRHICQFSSVFCGRNRFLRCNNPNFEVILIHQKCSSHYKFVFHSKQQRILAWLDKFDDNLFFKLCSVVISCEPLFLFVNNRSKNDNLDLLTYNYLCLENLKQPNLFLFTDVWV